MVPRINILAALFAVGSKLWMRVICVNYVERWQNYLMDAAPFAADTYIGIAASKCNGLNHTEA